MRFFSPQSGLTIADEIQRLARGIELIHVELAGHKVMLGRLRRARDKAMRRGEMTPKLLNEVRAEIAWRLRTGQALRRQLYVRREQYRDWQEKLHIRSKNHPRLMEKGVLPEAKFTNPYPYRKMSGPVGGDEYAGMLYRFHLFANAELLAEAVQKFKGKHLASAQSNAEVLVQLCNTLDTGHKRAPTWVRGMAYALGSQPNGAYTALPPVIGSHRNAEVFASGTP